MDRNHLKGRAGDRINAVLAAAGFNFKQIATWLRAIVSRWLIMITLTATPDHANKAR